MASIINTNIASLTAQNNLTKSQSELSTAIQRLSSGLRINSAKDDAAGLAISTRFTTQINGLDQAKRNANDGISLAQTAEGALSTVTDNLQRVRQLAVQSANATNSASDRQALDAEVQQRLAEINRVAKQTSFNGRNVLDGSFKAQQFQVGANVGQTISIDSIDSAKTADLGTSAGFASSGSVAVTGDLAAGDLTVNGHDVGAVDGSAKAIATAITKADSSVVASASATSVAGASAPTAFSGSDSIAAGDITINGTAIGAVAAGGDASTQAQNVVAAINDQTATTGVTASVSGGAVNLSAADGSAINVGLSGTASTANSGLTAGSNAVVQTTVTGTAPTAFASGTDDIAAGDLKINGTDIGAIAGGGDAATQATNVKTAINLQTAATGVTASVVSGNVVLTSADNSDITVAFSGAANTARTGLTAGTTSASANTVSGAAPSSFSTGDDVAAGDLKINGVDVGAVAAGGTAEQQGANVAAAINALTDQTGVSATAATDGTVTLNAADGRNIKVEQSGTATTASTSLTAGTTRGTVSLQSANEITVAGANPGNAGLGSVSFNDATVGTKLDKINVLDVGAANNTLRAVDYALQTVSGTRAELGAYQNRFQSAIENVTTTSQNLTSARSRIQDADFAKETAALTRAQILQQAGTAVVAQANKLPRTALSLLQ